MGMFEDMLEDRKREGLLREIHDRASAMGRTITVDGRELLNFASNDYLGLASNEKLKQAASKAIMIFGTGAGASRLLSGGTRLHEELEQGVASFKGTPSALVFNSGYAANTGVLPALAGEGNAIFSDELNHASLIDGCRLSGAAKYIYRHADMEHLEDFLGSSTAKQKVVATDSVFSMDGDIAPLAGLMELSEKYGAILYIDDAHGTGTLGNGRGALAHFGLNPGPRVIQMGTFSKALGSFGAFVAADRGTTRWLINSARSLIYSTALPPAAIAASIAALEIVGTDSAPVERLWENRERLAGGLADLGLNTGRSRTPIIPVLFDSVEGALAASARLRKEGIYAPAIRPPTVKRPRLRLTVTAAHTEEDIARILDVLSDTL
jgi:8-amino-7-oxononanoate synthase